MTITIANTEANFAFMGDIFPGYALLTATRHKHRISLIFDR